MINKDELIFAVDENNNPIAPVPRHRAHTEGIWHRITDVLIINSKQELLCNKRSLLKDAGPGEWDFGFGGHLLAGEDPLANAINEVREESGLNLKESDLKFLKINKYSLPNTKRNHFNYVYLCNWDGNISDLKLETEEIAEAKWFPLQTVIDGMTHNENHEWVNRTDIIEVLKSLE